MSLLDDVSIVVTPNGYKAGELYAVVPEPTEGAEEVTNGDFSNGLTGWDKSPEATLSVTNDQLDIQSLGGSGEYGYAFSTINFIAGKTYIINLDIISTNVPNHIRVGASTDFNANPSNIWGSGDIGIGSHSIIWVATNNYAYLGIGGRNDVTTLVIDNVSVKEVITASADMDVTRATAGTRVDEDGLVNYAEVVGDEDVTDGDFPSGTTAWTFGAGWSLGTNKAERLVAASSTDIVQASVFPNLTSTFKISFDVVRSAGSVRLRAGTYSLPYVGATDTYIYYVTPVSNNQLKFQADSSFVGSISNVSVKEVTRDNVPRIDYTGGGCPHILAEPQRTNLITYSEDFTDSSWTKLGSGTGSTSVVTSNYAISPDGTQNATRLVCDLNGGTTTSDQSLIYDLDSSSTSQSISIYMKSNTGSNQNIYFANTYGTGDTAIVTSEWQRFEFNHSTSNHTFSLGLRGNTGADDTADILIWGAQSESGSYPTSYIPTSGSTVTRNQDIFTRDGIGSLINSTEGVLFVELSALSIADGNRYITLTNGLVNSYGIRILYQSASGSVFFQKYVNGTRTTNVATSSITTTDLNKLAIRYNTTNVDVWVNGIEILTNSDTNLIPSGTLNRLAFDIGDVSSNFFGKVKQLQVYNTALTDEQLLQLTGTSGTDFYESYAEMASALTYTIQ